MPATPDRAPYGSSRLLLRLYGIGILTMVAVAATLIVTRVFRERSRRPMLTRTAFGVAGAAEVLAPDPRYPGGPDNAEIGRYLERLRREAQLWIALYAPDGQLIATNSPSPLPAPTADERTRAAADPVVRVGSMTVVVPIRWRGTLLGYGVARPMPPGHRRELAIDVSIALAWIGLAALLVSRTLGRPLEQIAAAARAFGRGHLAVRTGVNRRDAIGDVARAFDDMSERITKLLAAQCELLASVSHELRTPLSRIRVALDLAEEGDAETARASLVDVAEDLTEMEELIKDIWTAARLEMAELSGKLDAVPLTRADVPIVPLVERAVRRLRGQVPSRSFLLDVQPACDGGQVHVDAMMVRRALENVLENAQKYSPAGAPVQTTLNKAGDSYVIQVVDRGFGISAGDLPRVFTPFFRADPSRTRATGGVGLGLALAKRVIEAHGGTITLTSEVDVGTTVTFTLPGRSAGA